MAKTALVTGITGQDGSYLADYLLELGYEVHGTVRRSSTNNLTRIAHLDGKIHLHDADLADLSSLIQVLRACEPDEVYNLAAQSFVPTSWSNALYTTDVNATGVGNVLEAIRLTDPKGIRFYQASSSEMFGKVQETPQRETTPFYPRSPYGVSKLSAHWLTINYRESYGMLCVSGILFNHCSPRQKPEFIVPKICRAAARIYAGLDQTVSLGNLSARRDLHHAKDAVRAMHLMLQQEHPDNFVIASGETHTVQEIAEVAFDYVNLDWSLHVKIDPALYRPAEVDLLLGDASKAREVLGWEPTVSFRDLIEEIVDAELATYPELETIGRS